MATAIAEPEVDDPKLEIPPTVSINKMSDRFKDAMSKGSIPPPGDVPKPPEPPKPSKEPAKGVPEPPKSESKTEPEKKPKIPADNFKALETQRDEFKAKHEAAETKLAELQQKLSQAVDPAKIAELEQKITATTAKADQYETIVQKFYVEHSPQFKAAFTDKIDQSRTEAKEAVGADHAAKIESVLRLPPGEQRDKAVEEIGDELRSYQQTDLVTAYRNLKRTEKARDEELAKASENYKKLEDYNHEQAQISQRERLKSVETAFKEEASNFMTRFAEFQLIEGNKEHNEAVKQNLELAKNFLAPDLPPTDRARLALWAARGYASVKSDLMKDALISKLQSQITSMQAGNPGLEGGGKGKGEKATPLTPGQKFSKALSEGIPQKD